MFIRKIILSLVLLQAGLHAQIISSNALALAEKYPNEHCYSQKEIETFSFRQKKGKLSVIEKVSSQIYTPDFHHEKMNVMFYDDYSELSDIRYSANGTLIKVQNVVYAPYENEDIFHDDLRMGVYTLQMVKNSLYETFYTKLWKNPRFLSRVFFHQNYPIAEKTVRVQVPDWVELEIKTINTAGYDLKVNEKVLSKGTKEISYTLKDLRSIPRERHAPRTPKFLPHLLILEKLFSEHTMMFMPGTKDWLILLTTVKPICILQLHQ
jgi:hypothetical protein